MSTLDDIAEERQRLADRLSKIEADRLRVAEQLAELEAAERVLSRLGTTKRPGRRRGRRAAAAAPPPATAEPRRGRRGRRAAAPPPAAPSLGEATLRAVEATGGGISADDIRQYLAKHFGMEVRPNHLGMALQRHRRAGRLENRDTLWFAHHANEAAA